MRTIKIFIFIIFSILALAGCNKNNETTERAQDKYNQSNTNAQNNGRVDPHPQTIPESDASNKTGTGNMEAKIELATIQCNTCKKNITKALKTDSGIKDFNVNVEDKFVSINYDKSKTSLDKIEGLITAAGYDANGKKADQKAYDNLDECCKVPEKK
ncbi:hypothetical protein BH10BAC5_BH10BAC5_03450 [soil metagenome]